MKTTYLAGILLSSIALGSNGCSSSSPSTTNTTTNPAGRVVAVTLNSDCPLEKTSWLVVDQQANLEVQSALAKQLSSAAIADANNISVVSNHSTLHFASSLQKLIDENANKKVKVSQAFYNEYTANRNSLCAVLEALRRGSIKKEESSKTAETAFRKIALSFEKFDQPKISK